jgi:hypothetical protein
MVPTMCMVQAGQIPPGLQTQLRKDMEGFSQRSFGAPPSLTWIEVPENSGFTAGVPSTSILVSMQASEPLETPRRVELLKELCDIWIERTGKSINEVVGVISDPKN